MTTTAPVQGDRLPVADLSPWDLIEHDGRPLIVASHVPDPAAPGRRRLWLLDTDWREQPPVSLPADAVVTLAGDRP